MDSSFDIFQIYSQYCEITTREVFGPNDELLRARTSREALSYLLKISESKINTSVSILEEVYKLMSRLDLMADFSEFSRFYDFVFFICREKGQRNITVSMAVAAWRLVLTGRFRLLDQWCKFVEENQKHNISEDTWRQVLAFSRCVHENLEGYDPEGAWPVLIDDFVEYMYRTKGSQSTPCLSCSCGDPESQQCEDMLSGLKIFPGSKRKTCGNSLMDVESKDETASFKRRHVPFRNRSAGWGHIGGDDDDCAKHGTPFDCTKSHCAKHGTPFDCTKSHCAVEGCLSKGFAGLLSGHSCLQFDQDRRVSYT